MNRRRLARLLPAVLLAPLLAAGQGMDRGRHAHHEHAQHHGMELDRDGMVMNANPDTLPQDCGAVSEDVNLTVHVGREHARTGRTWGYDRHVWTVPPCARIRVRLVNGDDVRHQWMVHGLPRYLYPQGMFHLEVSGRREKSGSFIVPSDDATYLVHCDISHHMEQGLKGQLVVGSGAGDLPSIPGVSGYRMPDDYGRPAPR